MAFWLRIGSGIETDEAFAAFRKAFDAAPSEVLGLDGQNSGGSGCATFTLMLAGAGHYRLAGRVLTPTPDDDSFFISLSSEDGKPILTGTSNIKGLCGIL